jgi:hypothetical protein
MVAAADGSLTGQTPAGDTLRVREVWQDNLEAEMQVRRCSVLNGAANFAPVVRLPPEASTCASLVCS